MSLKVKDRALMKLMLEALIESRKQLEDSRTFLTGTGGIVDLDAVAKSLDHSNAVIHRALVQLRECDLA